MLSFLSVTISKRESYTCTTKKVYTRLRDRHTLLVDDDKGPDTGDDAENAANNDDDDRILPSQDSAKVSDREDNWNTLLWLTIAVKLLQM